MDLGVDAVFKETGDGWDGVAMLEIDDDDIFWTISVMCAGVLIVWEWMEMSRKMCTWFLS